MRRSLPAVALLLTLVGALPLPAQVMSTATLQVQLWYGEGKESLTVGGTAGVESRSRGGAGATRVSGSVNTMIRVQLQDDTGNLVSERSPDQNGRVTFNVQARGRSPSVTFRVRVIGPDTEEAIVDGVDVFRGERALDVTLRRKDSSTESKVAAGPSSDALVSLNRLQVPDNARKELDKGNDALQQGNLAGAEPHFRKAIDLFPSYDQAYNNLGVVLASTGRAEQARQAFDKAIALNDKFARAYVNLGRLDIQEKRYEEADASLHKSLQADPRNAEAFMLAAEAAFFTNHMDDAVSDVRQMHKLPHPEFGFGHLVAARALEALNRPVEAAAEYRLFLQEAPNSPNVPGALASLEKLKQAPAHP